MENEPVSIDVFDYEVETQIAADTKRGRSLTMVVNPATKVIEFRVKLPGGHRTKRSSLYKALEYYNIGTELWENISYKQYTYHFMH